MSIVRAKKHLGQHFLKDQNIACKITASLLPVTKGVLEIGPGMGVLTRHLLKDTKFSVLADYLRGFSKIGYSKFLHRTVFDHRESSL